MLLFALVIAIASPGAIGQSSPPPGWWARLDMGKWLYEANCAVCHGTAGKGDGPYKRQLTRDPSDLTVLARNNKGVFPVSHVYQVIDGRAEVGAHGPREMPIWGYGYIFRVPEPDAQYPYETESAVRARILALIDYLNRLQAR